MRGVAGQQLALAAADRGEFEKFHDLAWRTIQTGPRGDPSLMYLLARGSWDRRHSRVDDRVGASAYRSSHFEAYSTTVKANREGSLSAITSSTLTASNAAPSRVHTSASAVVILARTIPQPHTPLRSG